MLITTKLSWSTQKSRVVFMGRCKPIPEGLAAAVRAADTHENNTAVLALESFEPSSVDNQVVN